MLEAKDLASKMDEYLVARAWNAGDVDVLDEVLPVDFVYKAPMGVDLDSLEAFKEQILAMRRAYPDLRVTINEQVVDLENKVVVSEWTFEGTNTGNSEFMGLPTTGKPIEIHGASLSHIEGNHYADELVYYDALSALQQLGLLPEMAA
jgi:steroid delta-isomerase-like uncharacterized protein